MKVLKNIIRPYYKKIRVYYSLYQNFWHDLVLFKKYSIILNKRDLKNKEADLILNYHSLEKGMLFKEMKPGFARYRIENLHKILNDREIVANSNLSQIKVGFQVMCKYYELHLEKGIDIENFYKKSQYLAYKTVLENSGNYYKEFLAINSCDRIKFYSNVDEMNFLNFAHSRQSVRKFTGEKIPENIIEDVISLANTAPSVCNRQASNVYLLDDKSKIDKVLNVQGGFVGYTEKVSQLLIVTNDRKYYYTVGERNQFYIDGGLYLMNLLYSLHFYKVGNCPANWGKTKNDEFQLNEIIQIPESEKIICLIPIGVVDGEFATTLSLRRPNMENLYYL